MFPVKSCYPVTDTIDVISNSLGLSSVEYLDLAYPEKANRKICTVDVTVDLIFPQRRSQSIPHEKQKSRKCRNTLYSGPREGQCCGKNVWRKGMCYRHHTIYRGKNIL